ncbi:MAG: hypothetical protein ABWY05_02095 [Noviherbaspirillum sp.]
MFFLNSRLAHYGVIFTLATVLAMSSCSQAGGPAFAAASVCGGTESGIYLYRRGALAAYGQQFTVLVNGRPAGYLANASYLRLPLTPGSHILQIKPGGAAQATTVQIQVQAGAHAFYEFVFPPAWPMWSGFDGAAIESRAEAQALTRIEKLRRM